MKINGRRLTKFVEKEHGDTLGFLKICKSKNVKRKIKKQLNTRIKKYLNKWE